MSTARRTGRTRAETFERETYGQNRYTRVLQALKQGPMPLRDLAVAANIDYVYCGPLVGRMVMEGVVVVIGSSEQTQSKRARRDARIFALAGTPKLPARAPERESSSRNHSKSGSGQIAGPIVIGRQMMQRWGR